MLSPVEIKNIIYSCCEDCGWDYRDDYSGRCMFGQRCIGIDVPDIPAAVSYLTSTFTAYTGQMGTLNDFVGRYAYDNMGMGYIIYFPDIA